MIGNPKCKQCGVVMRDSYVQRRFCSIKCKTAYWRTHPSQIINGGHVCRWCKAWFPISKHQHNKWLCSNECRRKMNSEHIRKFRVARPERAAEYRSRTRIKLGPDSVLRRFYIWNPAAPRKCESCGDHRVLEVAHKPKFERVGEGRKKSNSQWPAMVWVLCPTCHALVDRIHYAPSELGLSE